MKSRSMRLGGGGRFAAFKRKLMKRGYSSESAEKIAAASGRKKYGKTRFQRLSLSGRK